MAALFQILTEAKLALSVASDTAALDAEVLLAHVLRQSRAYLHAWPEYQLTNSESQQFADLLQRRLQREPIAYLTGHKEFWSLDLLVNADTLVPRPETELLVETALNLFPDNLQRIKVIDLGTGSGAVALSLANERPRWEVMAIDVSENALNTARENAQRLGLQRVSFHLSNWFTALPTCSVDLVVANPPYLSEVEWPEYAKGLAFEPRSALVSGEDGLHDIRLICRDVHQCLRRGGYLLIEHGLAQGAAVRALLTAAGFCKVNTLVDLAQNERVTMGEFRNI
jgi:release factor glutamine methyltransferase